MRNYDDEYLKEIYKKAKDFLISQMPVDNPDILLSKYLEFPDGSQDIKDLPEIFKRILSSAQNANMKASVIGKSINGVENLGKVLFDFNHIKVLENFHNSEQLLDDIFVKLNPNGKQRREANSIWTKYCKTILETAQFLSQFQNGEDFHQWVNFFYQDNRSKPALPMILSQEIYGLGYALACDFLKELGFIDYGKPDVHIIEIFQGLGLCDKKSNNYAVQKIIIDIAKANNVSAYNVDKLFWLIGSGDFYKEEIFQMKIGRQKQKFLELMQNR